MEPPARNCQQGHGNSRWSSPCFETRRHFHFHYFWPGIIYKPISDIIISLRSLSYYKALNLLSMQPHFRRPLFMDPKFSWSMEYNTFGDGFHYFFYILRKVSIQRIFALRVFEFEFDSECICCLLLTLHFFLSGKET